MVFQGIQLVVRLGGAESSIGDLPLAQVLHLTLDKLLRMGSKVEVYVALWVATDQCLRRALVLLLASLRSLLCKGVSRGVHRHKLKRLAWLRSV